MKRIAAAAVCLLFLLTLAACQNGNDPQPTAPPENTPTAPLATDPPSTEPPEPFDSVRSLLSDRAFAVAYLGTTYELTREGWAGWLEQSCPNLLQSLPELAQLPWERVFGEIMGEAYLIVPASGTIQSSVSALYDGQHLICENADGDSFVIFCNGGQFYPGSRLTVTSATGETLWDPCLGEDGKVLLPQGAAILDITDYEDHYEPPYLFWQDLGWYMPERRELENTCWVYEAALSDGTQGIVFLDLYADGAAMLDFCCLGDSQPLLSYSGSWDVYWEGNGILSLALNRNDTSGMEGAAQLQAAGVILLSPETDQLFLSPELAPSLIPMELEADQTAMLRRSVG